MSELATLGLPDDLQARLTTAGVTDAASLEQTLANDPDLQRDVATFAERNQESLTATMMAQLVSAFLEVADSEALVAFWGNVPLKLEEPFIATVEAQIAQADAEGAEDLATGLRERLAGVRQLQAEQQVRREQVHAWANALTTATNTAQVSEIWRTIPTQLEDTVLTLAEQHAEQQQQAGNDADASRISEYVAALRAAQQRQHELANQLPYVRALLAFLDAPDNDAARLVFAQQRELLQPAEAQQYLDGMTEQASTEQCDFFAARRTLLRELRGVGPQPLVPTPTASVQAVDAGTGIRDSQIGGNVNQAGGNVYINAAHVEGSNRSVVVNNVLIEHRWTRPQPPPLRNDTIVRQQDFDEVKVKLAARGQVAISGRRSAALALQGMPGIGKTTLARQLALELDSQYPDGVIWQPIGEQIQSPAQVQTILNAWARIALVIPPQFAADVQFEPNAVRALLGEHPRLLVILDNVWSLAAIQPLRDALPREAHVLVTTRTREVLRDLGGAEHELRELTPEDARELIKLRMHWAEIAPSDLDWCDQLAEGVGRHTLALDVALGLLRSEGEQAATWRVSAQRVIDHIRSGHGFDNLRLQETDSEHDVELVLRYSYENAMDDTGRQRFRLLGAFAPDGTFGSDDAATLWQCDQATANKQLNKFVNATLLSRATEMSRWQQPGLLRAYALALLHREGEYEAAAASHAAYYDNAIGTTHVQQQYSRMLPAYPQLRHAFAWAIANDLQRAQRLISNTANLQASFGQVPEAHAWCEQALAAALMRGNTATIARAHVLLGNVLSQVATLAGEDRRARLLAALAAYDEALVIYTPQTAPLDYAATQNNRSTVLSDIATLAGEDRRARLLAALAAYDEALVIYTPQTAPLDYATTQNNRATVLSDIATLARETKQNIAGLLLISARILNGNALMLGVLERHGFQVNMKELDMFWRRVSLNLKEHVSLTIATKKAIEKASDKLREEFQELAGKSDLEVFRRIRACAQFVDVPLYPLGASDLIAARDSLNIFLNDYLKDQKVMQKNFVIPLFAEYVAKALLEELIKEDAAWREYYYWLIEQMDIYNKYFIDNSGIISIISNNFEEGEIRYNSFKNSNRLSELCNHVKIISVDLNFSQKENDTIQESISRLDTIKIIPGSKSKIPNKNSASIDDDYDLVAKIKALSLEINSLHNSLKKSIKKADPVLLTLTFHPVGEEVRVRWEAMLIGTCETVMQPPYQPNELALVLRALDALQYPNYPHATSDEQRRAFSFSAAEQQVLLDCELWDSAVARLRADVPRQVGRRLYAALQADTTGAAVLYAVRNHASATGAALALALRFPLQAVELTALPWELLWAADEATPLLFSRGELADCTRHLDLAQALPAARPRHTPLHILAIAPLAGIPASVRDAERAARQQAWQPLIDEGLVQIEEISPATRASIIDAVQHKQPDIIHYYGHGRYQVGAGELLLDAPGGGKSWTGVDRLQTMFRKTRLVALYACQGAMVGSDEQTGMLSGIAPALSAAGILLVIGMQFTIRATAATRVSAVIYRALAAGLSVQEAVNQARQALYAEEDDQASWYLPALYIRSRETGPAFV